MTDKLARFRSHWRWFRDIGQVDLIRQQSGRDALIRQVREDLLEALAKEPTQLYGVRRGWPTRRDVQGAKPLPITDEQVRAWVAENPFLREGFAPATQKALAFIETFNPARRT